MIENLEKQRLDRIHLEWRLRSEMPPEIQLSLDRAKNRIKNIALISYIILLLTLSFTFSSAGLGSWEEIIILICALISILGLLATNWASSFFQQRAENIIFDIRIKTGVWPSVENAEKKSSDDCPF